MAKVRGNHLAKRERTFSSSSTISTDDGHHDLSEQIVLDVTLEYFYKPRSLTALACLALYLMYFAFTNDPNVDLSINIFKGFIAVCVVFLVMCMLVAPNGPFTRPHPLVWRIVFGISVIYLLVLSFFLFLNYKQIKSILEFIDPKLKDAGPDTKLYAVDCRLTWSKLRDSMDLFILSHFLGWAGKSLLIRHAGLCWAASITWEITELFFIHLLPNFKECWWDAILLDIIICNGLGIHCGLYLCKKLEMRSYHWESIKDIQSTTGKLRRAMLQFTPASWTRVSWTTNSTYKRFFSLYILGVVWQLIELNTFFLKHIFRIPNPHPLNLYRLIMISIISAPTIRQYYIYITDNRSKRMGAQCWVFVAITTVELLICIKFGTELFAKTELRNVALWLLFQLGFSFVLVCWMIWRRSGNRKEEIEKDEVLDKLPSEESTKAYNYVTSNGANVVRREPVEPYNARITRSMARGRNSSVEDGAIDVKSRRKSSFM